MVYLFCDFGLPYTAEMRARIAAQAPAVRVDDLLIDAPVHDPRSSSKVLQGLSRGFPANSVFVCVVDPGVGGTRLPLVVHRDGHWFVGPDNGLFEYSMRAARRGAQTWEIVWRPERLSATFHGRDLFAPIAGRLAGSFLGDGDDIGRGLDMHQAPPTPWGCIPLDDPDAIRRPNWPDDVFEIVYFDGFGNAFTGVRAETLKPGEGLRVNGRTIPFCRTFSDVPKGYPLAYENAYAMVEIAINGGSAEDALGLFLGGAVEVVRSSAS